MREGIPSLTALGVAMLRGIATDPRSLYRIDDPYARELLPFPLSLVPRLAKLPLAQPIARLVSGGLLDHVALRTAAIDEELRGALVRGIDQVVILGAGLDARAWRMSALAHALVFEVDVESTQRIKRERLERRAPSAREVRFVTVDFARDDLGACLERAGHDASRPTIWIWEGVMPYLPLEASRSTLRTIRARSAPESALLLTYLTPEHVRMPGPLAAALPAVQRAFEILGEPLSTALEPVAMRALLEELGFDPELDTGSPEWARARLRRGRIVLEITERLAVARVR